jgi:hypothetical protein
MWINNLSTDCGYLVDRLFRPYVERCPQVVDIVEIPHYFLYIYLPTLTDLYIYKFIGCTDCITYVFL